MFPFCKKKEEETLGRIIDVGWVLDLEKGGFMWEGPRKLTRPLGRTTHAKGVSVCPAVIDHEARIYEVPCPIDIALRWQPQGEEPAFVSITRDQATIRPKHLGQMFVVVNKKEWRDPSRPIIQFMTPYFFIADESVYINQLPPFYHHTANAWPGLLIGGRFPIDVWPRGLTWAFEWYDTSKDLIIKRGEPWFYVVFETPDPSRKVRLIEAEYTPELKEYTAGLRGVTNYVSRTFSLFPTARSRRPEKLLVPKVR